MAVALTTTAPSALLRPASTSVCEIRASTLPASRFSATVPAAAAAIRPNAAAAAWTSDVIFAFPAAMTLTLPAAIASLRPVMLPITASGVLRSILALTAVSIVL